METIALAFTGFLAEMCFRAFRITSMWSKDSLPDEEDTKLTFFFWLFIELFWLNTSLEGAEVFCSLALLF
jgi:hypothetical protein